MDFQQIPVKINQIKHQIWAKQDKKDAQVLFVTNLPFKEIASIFGSNIEFVGNNSAKIYLESPEMVKKALQAKDLEWTADTQNIIKSN